MPECLNTRALGGFAIARFGELLFESLSASALGSLSAARFGKILLECLGALSLCGLSAARDRERLLKPLGPCALHSSLAELISQTLQSCFSGLRCRPLPGKLGLYNLKARPRLPRRSLLGGGISLVGFSARFDSGDCGPEGVQFLLKIPSSLLG